MKSKIKLVCNPIAGNHILAKNWASIQIKLNSILGDFSTVFTQKISDATTLTRHALHDGFETIIAMGGDGTINEVVNGFFENGALINENSDLGIISMGTGGDWVKTLELPENLEAAAHRITEHNLKKCDLGLVNCHGFDGNPISRYFINIADAGFGGMLAALVNKSTKALGPFVAYLSGLLRTLATYKNKLIHIQIDDFYSEEQTVNSVVIANGQFFGGGMWIAPNAHIDDGLFEVAIIGDVNRREVVSNIHKIYNGTLCNHPKSKYLQGKVVTLNSQEEILIETDGEQPGKLPATFEILPGLLKIIC